MHKYQKEVFSVFDKKEARFYILNWHRRARKSTLGLNLLIRECYKHSNHVYLYVAPTYKQAKSIIWRDPNMLNKWLPKEIVEKKLEQELYIKFKNGSILQIKGADDVDALRGISANGIVLDEWAVFNHPEIWEEIFRPIIAEHRDRWAMFIFTPKGQNHAFDMYNKALVNDDWFVSELNAEKSKLLPEKEVLKLKKDMIPTLYQQEMMCSFLADEEMTLITSKMIEDVKGVTLIYNEDRSIISCDPAFGGDECVIYCIKNDKIIDLLYLNYKETGQIVGELLKFSFKNKVNNFIIDCIGIGKGVADGVQESGKSVIKFCSAEKSYKENFYNKRAESYWYTMEKFFTIKIPYPEDLDLRKQLTSVRYYPPDRNGKIKLFPKSEIKKMLGRSPDRADTYTMGVWGLQFIKPENIKSIESFRSKRFTKKKTSRYNW